MVKDKFYRKDFIKEEVEIKRKKDNRTVEYFLPLKILWKSNSEGTEIRNEKALLENTQNQISLQTGNACVLINKGEKAGILLDFGMELQGGIEIYAWNTGKNRKAKLHVRFGESAMEAMSELNGEKNATNDHAIRDLMTEVSWLGMTSVGNTGFRFVRIDLEDEDSSVELKMVRAALIFKDLEYKGTFRCSDELLNELWRTSVYTVQLNMQDYLWDGIKRDRLVWIGDMHPEVSTITTVFGDDECVPKSLDFIRNETPLPGWMNGIPAYSMWWILIQHSWFMQNGNLEYLKEQHEYLKALILYMSGFIAPDGSDYITNNFIDWPSSTNPQAQKAGLHALFKMSFDYAAELFDMLSDSSDAEFSRICSQKVAKKVYDCNDNKQALALQLLADQLPANDNNGGALAKDGGRGFSTFLGYYILKALGKSDRVKDALDCIREYWGAMLKLGATTFWEDFDLSWTENCTKLDEIITENSDKKDIHGDFGGYCYKGYRHSLCHGWASGPAPFLAEHVLGIKPLKPGCKKLLVSPDLGDLDWASGSYPTPYGRIFIKHEKGPDGKIITSYLKPECIEIVMG